MNNLLSCLLFILLVPSISFASEDHINIGVNDFSPLATKVDGSYEGFEIDLIKVICKELNLKYSFKEYSLNSLLTGIEDESIVIGVGGISITSAREKVFNFSQPTYNSGYIVGISSDKSYVLNKILNISRNEKLRMAVLLFLAFLLIFTFIVWMVEWGKPGISDNFFPGFFETFWMVMCTITTIGFGDYTPKSYTGKVLLICLMFTGITYFGVILQITSTSISNSPGNLIKNRFDLEGKNITALAHTSSEYEVSPLNGLYIPSPTREDMIQALKNGSVDAIVYDYPWLTNYTSNNDDVKLVGEVFSKHHNGFIFNIKDEELKDKFNNELLKIRESGLYDELYSKWFSQSI